jgi:hypothetical protein
MSAEASKHDQEHCLSKDSALSHGPTWRTWDDRIDAQPVNKLEISISKKGLPLWDMAAYALV